jgi:hypothetical protein
MNTAMEQDILAMPVATSKEVSAAMELINSIDLSMVKMKIMDEEEGQGWEHDYADHVEKLYRRYLCMVKLNFNGSANVPTKNIDLFWHQHILDTRAYAKDCQKLFGDFLHHFPYFGMRGEQDAQDLVDSFEETKQFYFQLFGEEYCKVYEGKDESSSACHKCGSKCHKCASGCSGIKCTTCK